MANKKQYHIALGKGNVGRYVILPGDPGRVPAIAKHLENAKQVACNREFRTYTGYIKGLNGKKIKVSATSTGIGCPSAAIAVEELIKAGANTFIRVGTAGSLQKYVKPGDIVISTAAVREEGTTRQYVPLSYPAVSDICVSLALSAAANKLKARYHCGIVHCKDAFYTEDAENTPLAEHNKSIWKVWTKANVLATNMETSAIFVISSIRKVYAGEVLAIIGETWSNKPIISKDRGLETAIKTAIEAIKILEK